MLVRCRIWAHGKAEIDIVGFKEGDRIESAMSVLETSW